MISLWPIERIREEYARDRDPNFVGFCDAYRNTPSTSAGTKLTPAAPRPDQTSALYVAASLALFASIATLFWYILQIVMMSSRD